jgi:HEAT repeat protein
MSAPYADSSTDALIEEFVRLSKQTRNIFTLPTPPAATPERTARLEEIRAIGKELRTRGPIEKLRQLLDHEDEDVRAFAWLPFLPVDEEWAHAAISSLGTGLATREIVALCARAKRDPPERPTLQEMSVEQLTARFEDAGMRRYATHLMGNGREAWDVETSNRIMTEIGAVADELKSRDALSALLPLLDHQNVSVRNNAAACCLPMAPERAVPVLEAIAAGTDRIEKRNASWALRLWRERASAPVSP